MKIISVVIMAIVIISFNSFAFAGDAPEWKQQFAQCNLEMDSLYESQSQLLERISVLETKLKEARDGLRYIPNLAMQLHIAELKILELESK